ncbi:hypothetical protein [Laspinema olomoucense]|uniref:hypothetical protein n=1 Tax=Laspinema olomoucense TaxID=3231600 RepID=UPI0021BB340B|nr:hypothetical protein [Laspinema sp. D3a]MCT7989084.1 hypothetical protein [Laspinema sp. D3a]
MPSLRGWRSHSLNFLIFINIFIPPMTFSTLIHLLQTRAHQQPNQIAYTFLKNGKTPTSQLTYRQLDQKAKAIAAYLQSQPSPGCRVFAGCGSRYSMAIALPNYRNGRG